MDIKVIQHMLRHSSIKVTMDLYTNVGKEVLDDAARKLAGAIPRKPLADALGLPSGSQETTVDSEQVGEKIPETTNPQVEEIFNLGWWRVRHQGLEPRTRWLRASCSAN